MNVSIMYAKELHSLEVFSDYAVFQVESPSRFSLYSYSLQVTTVWDKISLHKLPLHSNKNSW